MILTNKRSIRGVSLIEFIVVTLILAVMGAIAFPLYRASQGYSRLEACKANIIAIHQAEEAYRSRHRTYTLDMSDLTPMMGGSITCPTDGSEYLLSRGSTGSVTTSVTIACTSHGGHTVNPIYDPVDYDENNPPRDGDSLASDSNPRGPWEEKGKP